MGLLSPPGRIAGGSIRFEGQELVGLAEPRMRALRGNRMAMIFQEPMTSLNPAFTIGEQIVEALLCHRPLNRGEARAGAIDALRQVRMPDAESRFNEYPHRLSGGMRQRAMIAMALVCRPRLLIADEPTTALDVTIQAQILKLMGDLQRDTGTAIILITHDLGVVAELADEVAVMYAGRVVERAPVARLFARAAASVHGRAAGLDAAAGRRGQSAADHRGPGAGGAPAHRRLPLRGPLSVRRCGLPHAGAGPGAGAYAEACAGRRLRRMALAGTAALVGVPEGAARSGPAVREGGVTQAGVKDGRRRRAVRPASARRCCARKAWSATSRSGATCSAAPAAWFARSTAST